MQPEGAPRRIVHNGDEQSFRKAVCAKEELQYNEQWLGKTIEGEIEQLQPVLTDLFARIAREQPDYLIMMDKGARAFGVPFHKFLHDLALPHIPEVLYWNDAKYKPPTGSLPDEEYAEHPQLHGKKLFFIDEIFHQGHGASVLKDFFDRTGAKGTYVALEYLDPEAQMAYRETFKDDPRFIVYNKAGSPMPISKIVSELYTTDGPHATTKRFTYSKSSEPAPSTERDQQTLLDMKAYGEALRAKVNTLIYESLSKIDKKNIFEATPSPDIVL